MTAGTVTMLVTADTVGEVDTPLGEAGMLAVTETVGIGAAMTWGEPERTKTVAAAVPAVLLI